jgi:hypothetical protein
MNKSNPAYEKAYALAVRIVNAYRHLSEQKREFVVKAVTEKRNFHRRKSGRSQWCYHC